MRKRTLKRILMVLMAVALIAPTILASVSVRAEDEDNPYVDVYGDEDPDPAPAPDPDPAPEPQDDPMPDPDPAPDPDPDPQEGTGFIDPVLPPDPQPDPPVIKAEMHISANPPSASFGTVNPGQSATTTITVSESGNEGANLQWYEVDNDNFFSVTAPSQTLLMPGDSVDFILTLNPNLSPGNYSGSMSFVGSDAAGNQSTDSVQVTATVQDNPPHVDSVTVSPGSASIKKGGFATFSATVRGTNLPSTDVTWHVRGNGSGDTAVDENGRVTIGADETAGQVAVVAVSVVDPGVEGQAMINVQSDPKTHYVSVSAGPGGTASGGGTVKEGESITVYASPNSGYTFKGWYGSDGSFLSNKKNLTIDHVYDDISLNAQFSASSAVVITNSSPGCGGETSGDGTYAVGSSVTVKANPYNGYTFKYWKMNDSVVSRDKNFKISNLNGEYRLYAIFERNRFTVTTGVSPSGAGAVDGAGTYDPGKDVTLKAYAASGYRFTGWYINYQLQSSSDTFTISGINSDYNVTAVFEKRGSAAYVMTSTAGSGGTITPAVSAPVPEGSNVSYTITPNAGYYISDVKIDGVSIGAVPIYAFTNVQANHKIEAFFAKKDANKGSKTSDQSDATTGKTMDQARDALNDASKSELDEMKQDAAETKLNTDMDQMTGVLQKYNMTPEEAYLHFNDDIGAEMFLEAFKDGYISMALNNDYSFDNEVNKSGEGVIYAQRPAITNMEEVYDSIVTDTEALGTLEGIPLSMNIDVTNMTGITNEEDLKAIQDLAKAENLAIDNTFDITILKTYDGVTDHITEMGADAEFSLKVPASLSTRGARVKILHVHDGEAEILDNLSTAADEARFRTNKLSTFAMAYETTNSFDAGKITGEQGKIYVDKINDELPAARGPRASKAVVIVLICVIALCVAVVAIMLTVNNKGSKKKGPRAGDPKTS